MKIGSAGLRIVGRRIAGQLGFVKRLPGYVESGVFRAPPMSVPPIGREAALSLSDAAEWELRYK
jgi:hypothetical protein